MRRPEHGQQQDNGVNFVPDCESRGSNDASSGSTDPVGSFVVFPYLNTSAPVRLCGFELYPASDVVPLTPEAQREWTEINRLFYLRDHLRIVNPTYIYVPHNLGSSGDGAAARLRMLQTCLAYFYTSPSQNRTPYLSWEHLNLYWLESARVRDYNLWPSQGVENELPLDQRPLPDATSEIAGYRGVLNGTEKIEAVAQSRIYPPVRNLQLNRGQDVAFDIQGWRSLTSNWALWVFFEREEAFIARNIAATERIVNALGWHNRGTSLLMSEESALLHLAIAFEALLNLEDGAGITERFKGTVGTLLGDVERLDWWADQFYTARSKIVHRGGWSHLGFYPVNPKEHRQIVSGQQQKEPQIPNGSLLTYGRHIFRLCVQGIVQASVLSWRTNLGETLMSNEDRLKRILEQLKDVTQPPSQRLESIVNLVSDLHELGNRNDLTVRDDSLAGAANKLVQVYCELNPTGLPPQVEDLLNRAKTAKSKAEHLANIAEIADEIDEWKCPYAPNTRYGLTEAQKSDAISVVWSFCDYFRFEARQRS